MTWPFENDTSAIVKKLAGRSMQADKRNKAFLLLTIAISAAAIGHGSGAAAGVHNVVRIIVLVALLGCLACGDDAQLSVDDQLHALGH